MDYYKIMDVADNPGQVKTLFHGINGSRTINRHEFIQASMKENASDGTSKSTYTAGWHVIDNLKDCLEYLKAFKNLDTKQIVRCQISGKTWPKAHSPAKGLVLAEYIYICETVMNTLECKFYVQNGDNNIPIEEEKSNG